MRGVREKVEHSLSFVVCKYDTRFNNLHSVAKFTVKCQPFLDDDTNTTPQLAMTLLQRMCALIAGARHRSLFVSINTTQFGSKYAVNPVSC